MKAKPMKFIEEEIGSRYVPCEPKEATHVFLNMPGPLPNRVIPVILKGTRAGTGCWSWNGDTEKPTLKPSISTRCPRPITNDETDRIMKGEIIEFEDIICHTFVNDGMVKFLNDSTHHLAGQVVPLLEVD